MMPESPVEAEIASPQLERAESYAPDRIDRELAANIHFTGAADRPALRRAEREQADQLGEPERAGNSSVGFTSTIWSA